MNKIKSLAYFQSSIVVPSLILSGVLSIFGGSGLLLRNTLFSYFLIAPLFHYFIYEVMKKNIYMLYANLGLSRWFLWRSTIIIGLVFMLLSGLL